MSDGQANMRPLCQADFPRTGAIIAAQVQKVNYDSYEAALQGAVKKCEAQIAKLQRDALPISVFTAEDQEKAINRQGAL